MVILISKKQAKALRVLTEHPYITAGDFALRYYDQPEQEYLFTAVSNQGNGACAGKKAWLCAGSFLGKLCKQQLVATTNYDNPRKFYVTAVGRIALQKFNEKQSK